MKSILTASAIALALSAPVMAGQFEDGAVAYAMAKDSCPGVTIDDESMGAAIFLAAAEAGENDMDLYMTKIAAKALVSIEKFKAAGVLDQFCATIKNITK